MLRGVEGYCIGLPRWIQQILNLGQCKLSFLKVFKLISQNLITFTPSALSAFKKIIRAKY